MSTTQVYQAAEQLLRRPSRPGDLVTGDKVRPQQTDSEALPFMAIELARNAVEFGEFGEYWRCQPDGFRSSERETAW